eukprot:940511-Prorocentrum_minimum.AAC.3
MGLHRVTTQSRYTESLHRVTTQSRHTESPQRVTVNSHMRVRNQPHTGGSFSIASVMTHMRVANPY